MSENIKNKNYYEKLISEILNNLNYSNSDFEKWYKDGDLRNPTKEDIVFWAYSNKYLPAEDWELAVAKLDFFDIIIALMNDLNCPNRKTFFFVAYVLVGDIVRVENFYSKNYSIENNEFTIKTLLERKELENRIRNINKLVINEDVKIWIERSLELIQNPDLYNYEYWGLGSNYVNDIK